MMRLKSESHTYYLPSPHLRASFDKLKLARLSEVQLKQDKPSIYWVMSIFDPLSKALRSVAPTKVSPVCQVMRIPGQALTLECNTLTGNFQDLPSHLHCHFVTLPSLWSMVCLLCYLILIYLININWGVSERKGLLSVSCPDIKMEVLR